MRKDEKLHKIYVALENALKDLNLQHHGYPEIVNFTVFQTGTPEVFAFFPNMGLVEAKVAAGDTTVDEVMKNVKKFDDETAEYLFEVASDLYFHNTFVGLPK